MKRCPTCAREYDVSMKFCLDDGAELLYGPASTDEPATAILHDSTASSEAATRARLRTTASAAEPRTALGESTEKQSFSANRAAKPLAAATVVVLVLVGGFIGYRY